MYMTLDVEKHGALPNRTQLMNLTASRRAHGFSLVELSIVLVIVGLIIGGVMVGRSMIRTASVNKVLASLQEYETATKMFQDQYRQLPGDLNNATSYWGAATGCATGAVGAGVCNGDGSGRVETSGTTAKSYEQFQFWRHLAQAGFIKGNYTGMGANYYKCIPGTNCLKGPFSGTGFSVLHVSNNGTNYWWVMPMALTVIFGMDGGGYPLYPVLTAAEAYQIDFKADDGKPGTGKIINGTASTAYDAGCATASDGSAITGNGTAAAALDAIYAVNTTTGPKCALQYRLDL
jgi:prepilin-type N-terminal cleavage/methylation domain-containing protein